MKIRKTLDFGVNEDRISTLPDAILSHILSFLPTKYAVATTILSTRWKPLFASVSTMDLDDSLRFHRRTSGTHDSNPSTIPNFIKFVYKLLLLRNSSLHKFRLKYGPFCDNSIINAWICNVILRNVKELDIDVRMRLIGTLPSDFFTCKTLEVLKLRRNFLLNFPSSFCLPNLKVLHLQFIKLDYSFERVLSKCRLLEDLSLHRCTFESIQVLEISFHSLKKLTLYYCGYGSQIVVDTPNLEYFVFNHYVALGGYLVKNLKSLIEAQMTVTLNNVQRVEKRQFYGEYVAKLIREMYKVRSLYLSGDSLEALNYSGYSLPVFQNLTIMELGANFVCGWKLLPELLESSPNLERLIFYEGFIGSYGVKHEVEVEYLLPEHMPKCLAQNLKEIDIRIFGGLECELKLVGYFLRNGQVLGKLKIGSLENGVPSSWSSSIYKRLLKFPRNSKNCEILLA